ncbi:MAG: TRL-like family protein [Alphaproteobacteria bacterium]|nr:TRL-like family protein [Alphaproteobacteria bacterium]
MKKLAIGLLILAMTALGGCVVAPSQVGVALIQHTTEPINATNGTGTKTGKACGTNILGLYASGDFSIDAAKKAGGITQVAAVDKTVSNILFLFAETCTTVSGS